MAVIGGLCLRLTQTTLRAIQLLASILVLGIFSYFLAALAKNDLPIAQRHKAIEGISGAAVLYGIFAVLLTLFLGAIVFFAFLAVVLDVAFAAAFIAVAYLTRGGARSCSGNVGTPLGDGPATSNPNGLPSLHRACMLEKAVFAVAIINVGLFLLSGFLQVALVRHHKREKRYGPSPSNNYTSGGGSRPFWRRNKRNTRDAEMATGALHDKHSHETGTTVDNGVPGQTGYGYAQPATNY